MKTISKTSSSSFSKDQRTKVSYRSRRKRRTKKGLSKGDDDVNKWTDPTWSSKSTYNEKPKIQSMIVDSSKISSKRFNNSQMVTNNTSTAIPTKHGDEASNSTNTIINNIQSRHRTKNKRKQFQYPTQNKSSNYSNKIRSLFTQRTEKDRLYHPLHLLHDRSLGISRDKRRHSSASIPSVSLVQSFSRSETDIFLPTQTPSFVSRILRKPPQKKNHSTPDIFDLENPNSNNQNHPHIPKNTQINTPCQLNLPSSSPNKMYHNESPRTGFQWKSSFVRAIPFSELDTCFLQAILALDPTGSYMMSIGPPPPPISSSSPSETTKLLNMTHHPSKETMKNDLYTPTLTLSFFLVPSPAHLQKRKRDFHSLLSWSSGMSSSTIQTILNHDITVPNQRKKWTTSPLLLTIPLQMKRQIPYSNRSNLDQGGIHIVSNRDAIR